MYGGSWYTKPWMCDTLFLMDHTCTFNTEILAALKMFKNRLFYHILKDFLITLNLRYIYAKMKILNALVWFPE